ncbi:hypothetical protein HYT25_02545 [Candidatus Pacearchaeota archaeon]|nr:hypothetical protein [Candidatus Pacearchaeota archaeon]
MIKYISPIDTHVHFRWKEYEKFQYNGMNFMQLGFRDARAVGLSGVIEMPNPVPQLTTITNIADRIALADKYKGEIYHGIYGGTTEDMGQVTSMVLLAKDSLERNGRINGIKIYHCHSTGNMGITDLGKQSDIWKIIGDMQFTGVVANHLEDEKKYTGDFDPANPITHSLRQNPESELIQLERQLRNAVDNGFQGIFYIAHPSNPETIDYALSMENKIPFKIVKEMTWHHMFLNTEDYAIHENRVKMNPPLRPPQMQQRNLEHVLAGNVDFIGTDHAPHPIIYVDEDGNEKGKDCKNPSSGIPAIPFYPKGIELLRKHKIKEIVLENILFRNANNVFNPGLKSQLAEVEYNPELWEAYGYNPFSRVDGTV